MANSIPVSFVRSYRNIIQVQYVEQGGKLDMIPSQREAGTAESYSFERVREADALERTTRHSETTIVDSLHTRRVLFPRFFYWADYIDKEDRLRLLADPQSAYVRNALNALRRKSDSLNYSAMRGNALEGKDGTTVTALPASQKIAHGSIGLTFEKLLDGTLILNNANVPFESRYAIINSAGFDDLLREAEITSRDFNPMQPLVTGQMSMFMGYNWVLYNFPAESNVNYGVLCHADSMAVGSNQEPTVEVDRLPTKHYLTQVYASHSKNYVRVQEEGVVEVAYQ
jgi:hypothetical protein